MPVVLGCERRAESVGRTQEHVGVWMCWVRVRSVVRRVWKVVGRRMGRVRARDSILGVWGRGRRREVCDGGGLAACKLFGWVGDDGDGVAAENMCQDASGLQEVALRWEVSSELHNSSFHACSFRSNLVQLGASLILHIQIASMLHHAEIISQDPGFHNACARYSRCVNNDDYLLSMPQVLFVRLTTHYMMS
jgi:hypothetical protein